MAQTACWRMKDGELVEKVVDGAQVPDGWYDNPRLEPNTVVGAEPVESVSHVAVETEPAVTAEPAQAESEPEPEVTVVSDITDEKPSEEPVAE